MGTHAIFSPSAMQRKMLCAGSHLAEQGKPNPSKPASILGTHVHTLIEEAFEKDLRKADSLIGEELEDEEGTFVVIEDMITGSNMMLDHMWGMFDEDPAATFLCEMEVNPGALLFRADWYGTADWVATNLTLGKWQTLPPYVKLSDYKNGSLPVDAENNPQGVSYLLGVIAFLRMQKIPIPEDTLFEFSIVQPKYRGVDTWQVSYRDLMDVWLRVFANGFKTWVKADAPRVAGDKQCQFCLAKLNCETRSKAALAAASEAFAGTHGKAINKQEVAPVINTQLPVISEMDNDLIGRICLMAPMFKGWIKDVADEGLRRALTGEQVPGNKVVYSTTNRRWVGDPDFTAKKLSNMTSKRKPVFRKSDIWVERLASFTKILANPRLSESQRKTIEDELLVKPKGEKILVPLADKREAVGANEFFNGIEEK